MFYFHLCTVPTAADPTPPTSQCPTTDHLTTPLITSPDLNTTHTTKSLAISGRLSKKLLGRARVGSGLVYRASVSASMVFIQCANPDGFPLKRQALVGRAVNESTGLCHRSSQVTQKETSEVLMGEPRRNAECQPPLSQGGADL